MKMGRSALGGMGIALAAILFVAVNSLAGPLLQGLRLDLTSDKLFTLSQGTRAILGRIDEPVTLRFYYSERLGREIPSYGVYAVRVREMLEEYRDAARGKLRLQIIDPPPFSDEEDRAVAFGLQAVPLNQQGETVYFGLAGSNTADKEESIAFFQPDRERFLEYDLTKLVYNLATPKKPVVGLMTMIPMAGEFRSMRPTPPSAVYSQLTQFFEVRGIEPNATEIPADIGVLMLVHPKELPESTLYAIDQFAMRGGRLLVFVDPHAESDAARGGPAAMGGNTGSDLKKIFDAWGIEMEPGKLLLHVDFKFDNGGLATLVMGTHQSRATPMEWWLVMGDHKRVEVRNVHEVRYFRAPEFKVSRKEATLDDAVDTLVWEPNLTVAANEDHKGYHAILGDFLAAVRGEKVDVPGIADGVAAMRILEAMISSSASGKPIAL
ncbi:MAG: Gldg family protein [Proteobacteria bacterium]|nr:Gldg family protein [Pseudomonadota bacterium]